MATPEHGQKTETDVVWLHLKVFWHSKEYLQGALKEKKRDRQKRWEDKEKTWVGTLLRKHGQLNVGLGRT